MTAQSLTQAAPAPGALIALPKQDHPLVRWFAYLLVAGAFFLIEHSWDAQARYQEVFGAVSMDDLQTGQMFETSAYRQLGAVALGIFGGLAIMFSMRKERAALGALGALIVFYLAWNALSIVWADDPAVSMRRYIMLLLLCIGAFGVQRQMTLRQIIQFTLWCPVFDLLLGIAAEYSNGTFHVTEAGYRFAGTLHPNIQAVNCAMATLAAISLARSETRHQKLYWFLAIFSFAFLFLTKSRTALAATVVVLILSWVFLHSRAAWVATVALVISGAVGIGILAPLLGEQWTNTIRLGRVDIVNTPGSLSGRTEVWKQAWEYVEQSPVLGYGYGGFWNEERTKDFIERQQWPVPHAHNAYLDILLEAGPLSLLAYGLIMIVGIRLGLARWHATKNPGYAFLAVLLLFFALNGILESIAIQRSLATMLCLMALCALAYRLPEAAENA